MASSFIVSNDHVDQLLASPEATGPRGGMIIGYEALAGHYLREAEEEPA